MLCKFLTELTTNMIRRCFASSKQTSQRQSPMYCKILTEVTKTIADVLQDLYRSHKDITTRVNQLGCFASSQRNSQPIKFADVLQVLSRRHKDNRRCIARS